MVRNLMSSRRLSSVRRRRDRGAGRRRALFVATPQPASAAKALPTAVPDRAAGAAGVKTVTGDDRSAKVAGDATRSLCPERGETAQRCGRAA